MLPGFIDTGAYQAATSEAAGRGITGLIEPMPVLPARRNGRPEEVADLCVFLCSERAGYITGQAIAIDGGWLRGLL